MLKSRFGRKLFFGFSVVLFLCSLMTYTAASVRTFPDHIFLSGGGLTTRGQAGPFRARVEETAAVTAAYQIDSPVLENIYIETAEMTLSLFGVPVKSVAVDILPDIEIVPVGMTDGIRIDTTGLMVLGAGAVVLADGAASRPCEGLIKSGDILLKADNVEIKDHRQFSAYLESLPPGSAVELTIKRAGQNMAVTVTCAVSAEDGKNKLGLWIRDSTKGIGTITYYNPANSRFAALGHGVVDVDTKQLIPVKDGRLYHTDIVAVKKGKSGNPGELVGEVNRDSAIGVITENTAVGLYGTINTGYRQLPAQTMRIALQGEVREGPAVILSNVSGNEIKQFDIYIERVNRYAADESKGMVIRITDQELITRTNGIVQGMSGCPIIQNGRLIGAVTHVIVRCYQVIRSPDLT